LGILKQEKLREESHGSGSVAEDEFGIQEKAMTGIMVLPEIFVWYSLVSEVFEN